MHLFDVYLLTMLLICLSQVTTVQPQLSESTGHER